MHFLFALFLYFGADPQELMAALQLLNNQASGNLGVIFNEAHERPLLPKRMSNIRPIHIPVKSPKDLGEKIQRVVDKFEIKRFLILDDQGKLTSNERTLSFLDKFASKEEGVLMYSLFPLKNKRTKIQDVRGQE